MRSVLRSLRSPAVIISILALVAGITGAAVAGPIASTSKLSKKDKKQVRNIADSEITKLAPTLSVKSATSVSGAGGVTQTSLKSSTVVTIDYPSITQNTCTTADSSGVPSLASLNNVAASDLILATPNSDKPVSITFVAGSLAPSSASGVYFDACNPTGAPINPPPFDVRVATIGA